MLTLTSEIRTPLHDWRAGNKLSLLSIAIVTLFLLNSPILLAGAAGLTALLYLAFGTKFAARGLRMLKPLRFFLGFILLWQVVLGDPVTGFAIVLRLATAVSLANLVTLSTRLDDLIDLVIWLASPARFVGVSPKPLALSIALVVRFVPVLLEGSGGKNGIIGTNRDFLLADLGQTCFVTSVETMRRHVRHETQS